MRILRLRMVNYRRHRDTEIEFPDGVTAIVGRNGSGKTTVIEAIAFALYGTSATRTNKALIRHDGAAAGDAVRVEVDAEVAGQAISVVRELRGQQQTGVASLTVGGQPIVPPQAGSSEAVTEEITRRIGLDREAFFNTVCAQQKELGRLAQKSKAERKRLVLGMLGVDALDRAIQEAGTLRRTAEARVQALQERTAALSGAAAAHHQAQTALATADAGVAQAQASWNAARNRLEAAGGRLEEAQRQDAVRRQAEAAVDAAQKEHERVAQLVTELEQRRAAAEQAAQEAEALRAAAADLEPAAQALEDALAHEHARQRLADAEARVVRLRQELDTLAVPPEPNGALDASRAQVAQARTLVEKVQVQATVLATEARALEQRLRRVAGLDAAAACPVCERPLEGHHELQEHVAAELADKQRAQEAAQQEVAAARARSAAAQEALEQAEQAARRHAEAVAARRRIEEVLGRALEDHAHLVQSVPAQDVDVAALRQRVAAAQSAHTARASRLALAAGLGELVTRHEDARLRLAASAQEVTAARQTLAGLPQTDLAAATQDHLQAAAEERQAERNHAAAVQARQLAAARCEAAAARQQEAEAAEASLAEALARHREWQVLAGVRGAGLLERFRNHLVARIGPAVATEASRLLGRFTAGRYTELLLDDDYEIYVTENGVPYQLERFSGGESDLVHLALRLAVSRLLVERSGSAEIRFLALDEVFGSLDGERRASVLAALQELGTLYSQVLLVTHHEDMQDALDRTLVVEEQDGAAVVRMHNG